MSLCQSHMRESRPLIVVWLRRLCQIRISTGFELDSSSHKHYLRATHHLRAIHVPQKKKQRPFLSSSWLTTELPAPMVGLGSPSGFEHNPSQDLLSVSLSGVCLESNSCLLVIHASNHCATGIPHAVGG